MVGVVVEYTRAIDVDDDLRRVRSVKAHVLDLADREAVAPQSDATLRTGRPSRSPRRPDPGPRSPVDPAPRGPRSWSPARHEPARAGLHGPQLLRLLLEFRVEPRLLDCRRFACSVPSWLERSASSACRLRPSRVAISRSFFSISRTSSSWRDSWEETASCSERWLFWSAVIRRSAAATRSLAARSAVFACVSSRSYSAR